MSLSSLFGAKQPKIIMPPPPHPVRNTELEAQMSSMGRRQGLISALFGYKNKSGGSSTSHQMTGQ